MESGETVRSSANDNAAAVAAGADLGERWSNLSDTGMRGGLSGEALALARRSEARLERRRGSVVILDVKTDDPDAPPAQTLSVEPDEKTADEEGQP